MNAAIKSGFTGHPAKLKEGGWGAHVHSDKVQPGDTVTLTTKGGKSWDAEVEKVVWTGTDSDGKACALCTLVGKDKPATSAPAPASASTDDGGQGADF